MTRIMAIVIITAKIMRTVPKSSSALKCLAFVGLTPLAAHALCGHPRV
jgi:hypothetical protein